MKNILVAVALAATVVTIQADAASEAKAIACAAVNSSLDAARSTGVQSAIDAANKAYTDAGCDVSCASAKAALDAIKSTGVQTMIDAANKDYKNFGCGAEALYGSLTAVAVAIYATTF